MKRRARKKKKDRERVGLIVAAAILIAIISVSIFLINSILNQPTASSPWEPKAAIVDQLSLTFPNQTFKETATTILEQAGYTVDYYPNENVTVEFYRNLPTHGYKIIILRVHSTYKGTLFTSDLYSTTRYVTEQFYDQISNVAVEEGAPMYFGIPAAFITSVMNGNFNQTTIIAMGCSSLKETSMAEAFIAKGAKTYIGWNDLVLSSHTDTATAQLLHHLITQKQTTQQAITKTMQQVGRDPTHNSTLTAYPTTT